MVPSSTSADADEFEVLARASAGSLFVSRTDVFHRGTDFVAPERSRFERATVRERELFGFPSPGDPYWNDQTVRGVQQQYPNIAMTPYEVVN